MRQKADVQAQNPTEAAKLTFSFEQLKAEPLAKLPRRYDIDALRALAFLLLILYHVGMFYVSDWGFHIKSVYQSESLKLPMILVNQWRMPLLFLVSGLASSFLLRKINTLDFIKIRSLRLWVPFMVGIIFVIPPQPYIEAKSNGTLTAHFGDMSYLEFLWHYFTFQGWPQGAFDGSYYGFTWNHLWFIPYLFTYTLLLISLRALLRFVNIDAAFNKAGTLSIILVPIFIQILWKLILNDEKPISHAFIDDGYAHGMYFTFFTLGYLISDKEKIWSVIIRLRWFSLCAGVITYFCLIALWWVFNQAQWQDHLAGVVATVNQWLWLLAVLGWSAEYLNKPYQWIKYTNDRVYPWYIFHQTITIIAGYYLSQYSFGGAVESILVIVITVAGCWICTEIIIGRRKPLKVLFGMK